MLNPLPPKTNISATPNIDRVQILRSAVEGGLKGNPDVIKILNNANSLTNEKKAALLNANLESELENFSPVLNQKRPAFIQGTGRVKADDIQYWVDSYLKTFMSSLKIKVEDAVAAQVNDELIFDYENDFSQPPSPTTEQLSPNSSNESSKNKSSSFSEDTVTTNLSLSSENSFLTSPKNSPSPISDTKDQQQNITYIKAVKLSTTQSFKHLAQRMNFSSQSESNIAPNTNTSSNHPVTKGFKLKEPSTPSTEPKATTNISPKPSGLDKLLTATQESARKNINTTLDDTTIAPTNSPRTARAGSGLGQSVAPTTQRPQASVTPAIPEPKPTTAAPPATTSQSVSVPTTPAANINPLQSIETEFFALIKKFIEDHAPFIAGQVSYRFGGKKKLIKEINYRIPTNFFNILEAESFEAALKIGTIAAGKQNDFFKCLNTAGRTSLTQTFYNDLSTLKKGWEIANNLPEPAQKLKKEELKGKFMTDLTAWAEPPKGNIAKP